MVIYETSSARRAHRKVQTMKMLAISFLPMLLAMVPFFYFLIQDSERNRDALEKVISTGTSISLVILAITLVGGIVFASAIGIIASKTYRRMYQMFFKERGQLYYAMGKVPGKHAGARERNRPDVIKGSSHYGSMRNAEQQLHDASFLRQVLQRPENFPQYVLVTVEKAEQLQQKKHYWNVRIQGNVQPQQKLITIRTRVYKDLLRFEELMGDLKRLQEDPFWEKSASDLHF